MTQGWEIRSVRVKMKNSREREGGEGDAEKTAGRELTQRKQEGTWASKEAGRPSVASSQRDQTKVNGQQQPGGKKHTN